MSDRPPRRGVPETYRSKDAPPREGSNPDSAVNLVVCASIRIWKIYGLATCEVLVSRCEHKQDALHDVSVYSGWWVSLLEGYALRRRSVSFLLYDDILSASS